MPDLAWLWNSGASEMSALLLLQSSLMAWGYRTQKHTVCLGSFSKLTALLSFPIIRLTLSLSAIHVWNHLD